MERWSVFSGVYGILKAPRALVRRGILGVGVITG